MTAVTADALPRPSSSTSAVPDKKQWYFVNAATDFLLIGGASIIMFGLARLFTDNERTPFVIAAGQTLAWVINWPHFAATNARLYGSRQNLAQYPVTAIMTVVLVVIGILGSVAMPETIAPWFVKFFLFWSPYHFSGQTVGITLLYARRTGFSFTPWMRRCLSTFVFSSFLLPIMRFEASLGGSSYYGIAYPSFGIPQWSVDAIMGLMAASAIGFVILASQRSVQMRRAIPPIVLLPAITQFVWFLPGARWATFSEFVPLFHSLQYMLIAWSLQLKERLDASRNRDPHVAGPSFLAKESLRWYAVVFVGGAVLFWLLPELMARVSGNAIFFSTGVVIAGVQIHHFFVDGVIWKLRSPSVRSPLLGTVDELLGRERRA